jgi:BirA family biotin operon repressor/biotin-[acetyl-CoA-carboxylase] ligase
MEDSSLRQLLERMGRESLGTRLLGRRVVYRVSVASTNTLARELAEQGAPEGTLVIAEEQTAGRGRLGRRWLAPRGSSVLISLIFRPQLPPAKAPQLVMLCGLAVRQAIREMTGLPAQLKWPNDVLIGRRKVGGILAETSSLGHSLQYAVVGIGLNVNLDPQALPAHFGATSIAHELGRPLTRLPLLHSVLRHSEERYLDLHAGVSPVGDWSAALQTLGCRVRLNTSQGYWEGLAEAVDEEGALLLRLDDGRTRRVLAGEIAPASTDPDR